MYYIKKDSESDKTTYIICGVLYILVLGGGYLWGWLNDHHYSLAFIMMVITACLVLINNTVLTAVLNKWGKDNPRLYVQVFFIVGLPCLSMILYYAYGKTESDTVITVFFPLGLNVSVVSCKAAIKAYFVW